MTAESPYQVFISHSSGDADWVSQIASLATQLGVRPYLFHEDQQPGRAVAGKLQAAIEQSDAFIAVITVAGGASTYVNQEIGFALGKGKPLIPIVERGVPSDQLAFLRDIEYVPVDFSDQTTALTEIAGAIHREVRAHVTAAAKREAVDKALLGLALLLIGLAVLAALSAEG